VADEIGDITDLFGVIEPYNKYFAMTKNSTLLGAIELTGRDPDGLTIDDHAALGAITQAIYSKLGRNISISQYYSHFDGVEVSLLPREDEIANALSQQRVDYLNKQNLSGSRLIHYFEIDPDDNLNNPTVFSLFKHLGSALFDARSRLILRNTLSPTKLFLVELAQLDRMQSQLQDAITEVTAKWNGLFGARQLTMQEIWAHMRFLASMNTAALKDGLTEPVPEEDMNVCLSQGDIYNVQVDKMEVLKLAGITNTYVKIAAVRRFSNKRGKTMPGLWAAPEKAPTRVTGNYVIMTRWKPLSELRKQLLFSSKNTALERSNLNFYSILTGGETQSILEKQATMKPTIRAKIDELGIAEALPDLWGIGQSYICVFGNDTAKIRKTSLELGTAFSNSRINVIWEGVSIKRAFAAFQPGQGAESNRDLYMSASQFAAASLIYQSSVGQITIPDMGNEEAAYLLQSKDGSVFHYSPYVNGRAMVIGVGPIRKGKTFLKNSFATHFYKYGGLYRAIDIDPGSEPVAGIFGDNAGIFRASKDEKSGANPFASCRGPDDVDFKIHLTNLLQLCLEANDTADYKRIEKDEQGPLDDAITTTINLPDHMQSLSTLVAHMPEKLQIKFSRWIRPSVQNNTSGAGWFSYLFDNKVDAIGNLDKKIGIFNLQALKDSPRLMKPVLADILYRITQAFEDPDLRHVPKTLDLDECHNPLSIPGFPEYLVKSIRTWGKWFGMVQMWTQSVEELTKVEGWSAVRGAATTFFFFSDPTMDEALYRTCFPFLTAGECKTIRDLIPQKEAYIIQPELGISKVVIINVEPAQRVVNTSHPREAARRNALIKQHGFDEGLRLAIEELTPVLARDPEDDIHSLLTLPEKEFA
jgi:type IV secretion system protein VirB4